MTPFLDQSIDASGNADKLYNNKGNRSRAETNAIQTTNKSESRPRTSTGYRGAFNPSPVVHDSSHRAKEEKPHGPTVPKGAIKPNGDLRSQIRRSYDTKKTAPRPHSSTKLSQ